MGAWLAYHAIADDVDVPFISIPASPQLNLPGEVDTLLRTVDKLPCRPTLTIVDTLSRTLAGSDSDPKDMNPYINTLGRIQREVGGLVGPIHHAGWNAERERGYSGLRGAVDTMLFVTRDDNIVTLSCLKQKDGTEFTPMAFKLVAHCASAVLVPLDENARKERPKELPKTRDKALSALKRCAEPGGLAWSKWLETSGLKKATFSRRNNRPRRRRHGRPSRGFAPMVATRHAARSRATRTRRESDSLDARFLRARNSCRRPFSALGRVTRTRRQSRVIAAGGAEWNAPGRG